MQELPGERAGPEWSQVDDAGAGDGSRWGRTDRFGDGSPQIGLFANDGTRHTEQRPSFDQLGGRPRAHRLLDERPLILDAGVDRMGLVVEPCRYRRDVVGTGERDRDPPVGGAQQVAGSAAADRPGRWEPEQAGAVGQQAPPALTELLGHRGAPLVEPRRLRGNVAPHRRARRPVFHSTMFLYASGIGHIDVSTSEYRELIDGPYLDELLAGVALVIVHPDGSDHHSARPPGSTPVVVCWAGTDDAPRWADVALDAADCTALVEQVGRVPQAAISLAVLLRQTETLSIPAALAAESAVYSMLQAGPEFAAWRRARHRPPPRP